MKVTDEMVDAYLRAQRESIEKEGFPNAGGRHRDAVRDACRAGIEAALSHAAGQECTLGVGDGSGQLFVHGSYDAIKLPCPFCGTANPRSYVQPDEHGRYSYGVQCVGSECSTCGPERGATAEAIAAWNRRTASPAEGRMGEMPSKLAADLQGIANGELPDGDGVDTSVSLWAERWLERLATSPADSPATLGEVEDLIARLERDREAWISWNEDHPEEQSVSTPIILAEAANMLRTLAKPPGGEG